VSREDADFLPSTKAAIAKAVNWQCSAPHCKNPAMGMDDGITINGGTACHIYSAAQNGPRGRNGLTNEELSAPSNGLWCCAFHGRIIDSNQGASFPAAQLFMWKRLAEARVRRAMAVEYPELGWLDRVRLSVEVRPEKTWVVEASLQKNNLIRGLNDSGKSLLLEGLASISQGEHARRLRAFPGFNIDLQYTTLIREASVSVSCRAGKSLERKYNGEPSLLAPADIAVLHLDPELRRSHTCRWPMHWLCQRLRVDEDTIQTLAHKISCNRDSGMSIAFRPLRKKDYELDSASDAPTLDVFVTLKKHGFELPFNNLADSESLRIVIAMLVELAREVSKNRPTLLCIDSLWIFDDETLRLELDKLASEPIQLLVVASPELSDSALKTDFPSWNVIDLASIQECLRSS
jgi:hypothetical protein